VASDQKSGFSEDESSEQYDEQPAEAPIDAMHAAHVQGRSRSKADEVTLELADLPEDVATLPPAVEV